MNNTVQIIMKGGHQMTKYRDILRLLSKLLLMEYLEQYSREGADVLMYSQFCY